MSILWWSTIDLTRASTTPEGSRAYLPPMWANFLVTCVTQFSCSTNGSWILYLQWLRRNISQTRRFEATQDPACAFTSEVLLHSLQEVESSKWICSKGSSDTAFRNYHHIEAVESSGQIPNWFTGSVQLGFFMSCTNEECPLFRSFDESLWNKPLFASRTEYTKHMCHEHDKTPFLVPRPVASVSTRRCSFEKSMTSRRKLRLQLLGRTLLERKALPLHSESLHLVHYFGLGKVQALW
jgi:hypothetical protein